MKTLITLIFIFSTSVHAKPQTAKICFDNESQAPLELRIFQYSKKGDLSYVDSGIHEKDGWKCRRISRPNTENYTIRINKKSQKYSTPACYLSVKANEWIIVTVENDAITCQTKSGALANSEYILKNEKVILNGQVTREGFVSGATVRLIDEGNILSETVSNRNGFFSLAVTTLPVNSAEIIVTGGLDNGKQWEGELSALVPDGFDLEYDTISVHLLSTEVLELAMASPNTPTEELEEKVKLKAGVSPLVDLNSAATMDLQQKKTLFTNTPVPVPQTIDFKSLGKNFGKWAGNKLINSIGEQMATAAFWAVANEFGWKNENQIMMDMLAEIANRLIQIQNSLNQIQEDVLAGDYKSQWDSQVGRYYTPLLATIKNIKLYQHNLKLAVDKDGKVIDQAKYNYAVANLKISREKLKTDLKDGEALASFHLTLMGNPLYPGYGDDNDSLQRLFTRRALGNVVDADFMGTLFGHIEYFRTLQAMTIYWLTVAYVGDMTEEEVNKLKVLPPEVQHLKDLVRLVYTPREIPIYPKAEGVLSFFGEIKLGVKNDDDLSGTLPTLSPQLVAFLEGNYVYDRRVQNLWLAANFRDRDALKFKEIIHLNNLLAPWTFAWTSNFKQFADSTGHGGGNFDFQNYFLKSFQLSGNNSGVIITSDGNYMGGSSSPNVVWFNIKDGPWQSYRVSPFEFEKMMNNTSRDERKLYNWYYVVSFPNNGKYIWDPKYPIESPWILPRRQR